MSALNPAPRIFSIPPELPFADALVDGVLYGGIIARSDDIGETPRYGIGREPSAVRDHTFK